MYGSQKKRMKKLKITLAAFVLVMIGFMACKKDGPALASETYNLYNYSSGSAVAAGTFTIHEQGNGYASLSIQLSSEYRVAGAKLPAYLTTADSSNLIFATLGEVDGSSGAGNINPVKTNSDNQPVKYSDLVNKKGYTVRVLNNSNVQATGSIN